MIFDTALMCDIWTVTEPLLFIKSNYDKQAFSRGNIMAENFR